MSGPPHGIVFLFDVDSALLDNDRMQADLGGHLTEEHGVFARDRYWAIFEQPRDELGYADYLGALQRCRLAELHDPRVLRVSNWLADYPFADWLYRHALDVVRHVRRWGPTVILSDGDAVFQPRKVERSGLWDEFEDRMLIHIHKEQELDDVERLYPPRHYVLIDDKIRILDTVKRTWKSRVTTVLPKQGRYALDSKALARHPPADVEIPAIGEMLQYDLPSFQRS